MRRSPDVSAGKCHASHHTHRLPAQPAQPYVQHWREQKQMPRKAKRCEETPSLTCTIKLFSPRRTFRTVILRILLTYLLTKPWVNNSRTICLLVKYAVEFIITGPNNGCRAFGYNSAESEPIWMKSGTL